MVDRIAGLKPNGCIVIAAPPEDAAILLPEADVVLLALGFENSTAYAQTVGSYSRWLRPGTLVVDLGSTKSRPMATLQRELPSSVGLLGAHPLFGPTVTDLTGLIVAAVDADGDRSVSPWRDWFLALLAEHRMIVVSTSAVDHDDAMGFVQALTHFVLLAFAYTFVRLNRDPADLLTLRTPIFEPMVYLAARVANLARGSPETYRAIQTYSTRPDARLAFVEAARELLAAIEATPADATVGTGNRGDLLTALFRRYGDPWSPDGRERRDRQSREHLLEMGVRLVDNLNNLRQEIVSAVGQVRAIEERRAGQASRVVVGVVDLDLLDPGKYDVASRIRLRRLNLSVGSTVGDSASRVTRIDESSPDLVIPLARARVLRDDELLGWLYESNQLVERRSYPLLVPDWFDEDVLDRLLKARPDSRSSGASQIWRVSLGVNEGGRTSRSGSKAVVVTLAIVVHPAEVVATRQEILRSNEDDFQSALRCIERELADVRSQAIATANDASGLTRIRNPVKDRLKRERKSLLDRRTADVDREVRRVTRKHVQRICDEAIGWLLERGCSRGRPELVPADASTGPNPGISDEPPTAGERGA
jgi:prephenate dehydrogenase